MITRVCNDCGEDKQLEDLVKSPGCKYGVRKLCKSCAVIRSQSRYDPTSKAAYDKRRRVENVNTLRSYDRERSTLPHRRAAHNEDTRKRKARLHAAIPDDYDRDGVLAMYKLSQKISNITGVQMHVDHIIPLARGGEHNVNNLQLLEGSLNIAKGVKTHFQLPWTEYP